MHELPSVRLVRQLDARSRTFGSGSPAERRLPEEACRSRQSRRSGPEAGGRHPQGGRAPVPRELRSPAGPVPVAVRHGGRAVRPQVPADVLRVRLIGGNAEISLAHINLFDESRAFHLYDHTTTARLRSVVKFYVYIFKISLDFETRYSPRSLYFKYFS